MLPYALIAFWGIVNQQAAKTTKLTAEDAEHLYEAIWYGTKNLITRSKIGQRPLLLLLVEYDAAYANSYIGRLDRFLGLVRTENGTVKLQLASQTTSQELRDEEIRDVAQVKLDLSGLDKARVRPKGKNPARSLCMGLATEDVAHAKRDEER